MRWKKGFIKAPAVGAGLVLALTTIATLGIWYSNRPGPAKPWNEERLSTTREYFGISPGGNRVQINYILENKSDADFLILSANEVEYEAKYKGKTASEVLPKDALEIDFPISVPAHSRKELTIRLTRDFSEINPPENGNHEGIEDFSQKVMSRVHDEMPDVEAFQLRVPLHHVVVKLPLY